MLHCCFKDNTANALYYHCLLVQLIINVMQCTEGFALYRALVCMVILYQTTKFWQTSHKVSSVAYLMYWVMVQCKWSVLGMIWQLYLCVFCGVYMYTRCIFHCTLTVTSIITLTYCSLSLQHVGEKSLKAFHKLQPIMRPANSHAHYRKVLSGVHRRDPCIPYFGMVQ